MDPRAQPEYEVRFDWGEQGVRALARASDIVAIVDVLSFSTAVTVACEHGAAVYPYRWRDATAGAFAESVGATLALRRGVGQRSLSPPSMASLTPGERIVLPSPNGGACASAAAETGATVAVGSLRNAAALASWAASRGSHVTVIAAGERWPDDTLRPAMEDLLGAGALIYYLEAEGVRLSPEARVARAAFRAFLFQLDAVVASSASGQELIRAGHAEDVAWASALDASTAVPVLTDGAFVDAAPAGGE